MKIDINKVIAGVESVVKAVNELMPIAEGLGAPAAIANVSTIAIAGIATVHNIIDRATELKQAFNETDQAKLRELIGQLQAVNDKLAGEIAEIAAEDAGGGQNS